MKQTHEPTSPRMAAALLRVQAVLRPTLLKFLCPFSYLVNSVALLPSGHVLNPCCALRPRGVLEPLRWHWGAVCLLLVGGSSQFGNLVITILWLVQKGPQWGQVEKAWCRSHRMLTKLLVDLSRWSASWVPFWLKRDHLKPTFKLILT